MIKQIIIFAIVLTLTASTTFANPNFGIRFGMGRFNMTGVENTNTTSSGKWGGTLGLFMVQQLGGFFFIQPAIILLWRGFIKTHTLVSNLSYKAESMNSFVQDAHETTENASLGYIQIPVLLRYEIPLPGKFTPRILLGPTFNMNISGKDKASGFGDWDGEHDIGNLKKLDIGGMIGVGVSFPLGKLNLGVDVIYDRSFSSAFKDVSEEELANDENFELWTESDPVTFERTTKAPDFRNTGISFQVSMMLPIGIGK
ncbi:MAG: hypothetical protein Kow0042_22050 [Calditrichia bacterium]